MPKKKSSIFLFMDGPMKALHHASSCSVTGGHGLTLTFNYVEKMKYSCNLSTST